MTVVFVRNVDIRRVSGVGAVVLAIVAVSCLFVPGAASQVAGTPVAGATGAVTPLPTSESSPVAAQVAPSESENFDNQPILIALAVGVVAAALIYGFWVLVRPKPGERVDYLGNPIDPAPKPERPERTPPTEHD